MANETRNSRIERRKVFITEATGMIMESFFNVL